jgi:hypothetical protein
MSSGPQFAPIYSSQQAYETGMPQEIIGTTTQIQGGQPVPSPLRNNPIYPQYNYALGASTVGGAVAVGAPHRLDADQVPLTREIDDFQRGYNDALERIAEEDPSAINAANGNGMSNNGYNVEGGQEGPQQGPNDPKPLWQQNRRQSRNLMWM